MQIQACTAARTPTSRSRQRSERYGNRLWPRNRTYQSGRLSKPRISTPISADMHPPLSRSEALIEADRCYFCYDAPCTTACPTGIDIPGIYPEDSQRQRAKVRHTRYCRENIMGGMCARVCPTEVLLRRGLRASTTHEDKPVRIGLLQRYSTDPVFESGERHCSNVQATARASDCRGRRRRSRRLCPAPTGWPLGARRCRSSTETGKLGGLNEYGIAAYKTVDDFAQREVDWILGSAASKCATT